jgi:hypothetical protein
MKETFALIQSWAYSPAFVWMESWMLWVVYWLMAFLPLILLKIIVLRIKGVRKSRDSMFFTEAIGLPLTFGQPFVFAYALTKADWLGAFLTLFWGPGFLFVVGLVLWSKAKKHPINWAPWSSLISWVCKLTYLGYLAMAILLSLPLTAFALSAWIASDQIEKSFASLDADRSRRSFHDFWLIRIAYPALLLSPWFTGLPLYICMFGSLLFGLWALGICYVIAQREFMNLPEDPTLLRNMRYFKPIGQRTRL